MGYSMRPGGIHVTYHNTHISYALPRGVEAQYCPEPTQFFSKSRDTADVNASPPPSR